MNESLHTKKDSFSFQTVDRTAWVETNPRLPLQATILVWNAKPGENTNLAFFLRPLRFGSWMGLVAMTIVIVMLALMTRRHRESARVVVFSGWMLFTVTQVRGGSIIFMGKSYKTNRGLFSGTTGLGSADTTSTK